MVDLGALHVLDIRREEDMGYIYFLFHGKVLVYIGQTISLTSRIGSHRADKYFTEVRYEMCPRSDMNRRESELIAHFNPILNSSKCTNRNEDMLVVGSYMHLKGKGSQKITERGFVAKNGKIWGKRIGDIVYHFVDNSKSINVYADVYDLKKNQHTEHQRSRRRGYVYAFDTDTMSIVEIESRQKEVPKSIHHIIPGSRFPYGKYKGKLMDEVKKSDPQYIEWWIKMMIQNEAKQQRLLTGKGMFI